jgi:uncharacterized protein YPO0396
MLESQLELEFSPDKSTAGYRLHELSLLNWGTFHEKVYTIRPDGRTSMITGRNGSGKSTLVDALLTLLVPNRVRNYNVASSQAGSRERNERDYVLGAYSEIHDSATGQGRKETLRKPGETYTVLLAHFFNEAYQSEVTIAQVLWCLPSGKVDKVYMVEKRKLTIEDDFNQLGDSDNLRRILKERGYNIFDSFTAYHKKFESMLFLDADLGTRSPMSIFNQAVCIKDVKDLTQFIREHMLDDGGAKEKLLALQERFDDLRSTHRRIETASYQIEQLDEIHTVHDQFLEALSQRSIADEIRSAIEPFYAQAELERRKEWVDELRHQEEAERARLKTARVDVDRFREKLNHLERALSDSDENRRLEQVGAEIDRLRDKREVVGKRSANFERHLSAWEKGAFVKQEDDFLTLRRELDSQLPRMEGKIAELDEKIIEVSYQLKRANERVETLEDERNYLLEANTNVPLDIARLRLSLATALDRDLAELPFVGELIQVVPDEAKWTGAIERTMRSFSLSIVVPAKLADQAEAFLEENHLGDRLAFISPSSGHSKIKPADDSLLAKLTIRSETEKSRQAWLRWEIDQRFPHICLDKRDQHFEQAKNAITLDGLVKSNGTLREKDDTFFLGDASSWVLGWDLSPKQKSLDEALAKWREEADNAGRSIRESEFERQTLRAKLRAGVQLQACANEFSDIDVLGLSTRIADLEEEERVIVGGSDVLKKLKEDHDKLEGKLDEVQSIRDQILQRIGGVEARAERNDTRMEAIRTMLDRCREERVSEFTENEDKEEAMDRAEEALQALYAKIENEFGAPPSSPDEIEESAREATHKLDSRIQKLEVSLDKFRDKNVAAMQRFIADGRNQAFRDELVLDLEEGYTDATYSSFEQVRRQIEEEDLAKNHERFEELLRVQVPEEVSGFSEALESHRDRIRKRVNELNEHLSRVTFDRKEQTFIQLMIEDAGDDGVRRFKKLRRHALEGDLESDDDDERRRERYHRVEQFLGELEQDTNWTERVIDVRNWFKFRADEFYKEEGNLRQSYSGAAGKSGGEKNRLASTILATAIAYQYGVDVGGKQTETFRLVAVDEMFSKTDDEFSQYLLDLFKEFHLQLLIVQPLDAKIHVVQRYVERYHVVERREGESFVGDLSVHEYLNQGKEESDEPVEDEPVTEPADS